jgi:hypothetical protein
MVMIRPTVSTDAPNLAATSAPLFYAAAGWLAIAAGTLLVISRPARCAWRPWTPLIPRRGDIVRPIR